MVNFVIHTFKRFSWFRRFNARITYELLAKHIPAKDWHFMNYGYVQNDSETPVNISADPKAQRYSTQMYHYLASKVSIEGKQVLEVGSGRGGGAKYLAGTFNPAFYTGMDLAQSAVDLANKIHVLPNLKYIQGCAETIPLPDSSIDVVINVESCHAYGSVPNFLSEIKRVLKPGGYLLLVDFRNEKNVENMETLRNQLMETGMDMISEENITDNVIRAIEEEDDAKQERIRTLIPAKWQKLFSDFAGVVGSRFHLSLKEGTRKYYRFVMQKQ